MRERHHRLDPHDRVEAMKLAWASERDALAVVRVFNAKLSAKRAVWFWPKIGAEERTFRRN